MTLRSRAFTAITSLISCASIAKGTAFESLFLLQGSASKWRGSRSSSAAITNTAQADAIRPFGDSPDIRMNRITGRVNDRDGTILHRICEHACVVHPRFPCNVSIGWSNAEQLLSCPSPWDAPQFPGNCGYGALRASWSWTSWGGEQGWLAAARRPHELHTSPAYLPPTADEVPTESGMPGGVPCSQVSDLEGTRGILIMDGLFEHEAEARVDVLCQLLRSNRKLRLFAAYHVWDSNILYKRRATDGTPLWKCMLSGTEPKHLEDLWIGHTNWVDDSTFEDVLDTLQKNPRTHIEHVRFNDNPLTARSASAFRNYSLRRAAAGWDSAQFDKLSFSDLPLGDDGIKKLLTAVPLAISWLSVSNVGLSAIGAQWLATQWLPRLLQPRALFLGKWDVPSPSADWEEAALSVIEAALQHSSLETLSMDAVGLSSDNAAVRLAALLRQKNGSKLQRVLLRGNPLSTKGTHLLTMAARPHSSFVVCAYAEEYPELPNIHEACPWYEDAYQSKWFGFAEH